MENRRPPRAWTTYRYFDPREVLLRLGTIEESLIGVEIDEDVLALRTRGLRPYNERRQAALFLYGMSCLYRLPFEYAPIEDDDFDCVARWTEGDTTHYVPVQLKELPPHDVNPAVSLQTEIEKLAKYVASHDLCVAYYLNREMHLDLTQLNVPKLNIAELWLFGGVSLDNVRWMLWGNLLDSPRSIVFDYPA